MKNQNSETVEQVKGQLAVDETGEIVETGELENDKKFYTPEEVTTMLNAVTKAQNTAVANTQHHEPTGFEDMGDEVSLILPVVKIMQATSPELDLEGVDFKKGNLVHSLLLEKMPEKFVPLKFFDSKILLVPKSDEKKADFGERLNLTAEEMASTTIVCQAKDGKTGTKYGNCDSCGLAKWDNENGIKPLCTHSINALAVFIEEDGQPQAFPSVLRFANTSFKHGRKLLSMAKMTRKIYDAVYKASTKLVTEKGNSWYELMAVPSGRPSEAVKAELEQMFNDFSTAKFDFNDADVPADIEEVGTVTEY